MPNKTIYVSDKDLPLYNRAQELSGGNLSKAISTALKRYVEAEEGRQKGYDEITLKVGIGPARKRRRQRFTGVQLGQWGQVTDKGRAEIFTVYRSKSGKFVIYIERSADWSWNPDQKNWWKAQLGIGAQSWAATADEGKLIVVDTAEELREQIPAELFDMVASSVEEAPIEDLDI
ncbi:EXLDI protein [Glycomyces buryatensis]|uniref:EXLDI protein n=1 Tax=Glycomyces buryatensis TaxID=2570927 RepID=A0A4S8QNZ0_9ACTN|nr:EXLDI protein [Glycomyces buryatensis]THV43149.1 EXLDI protein [Glycomyces buryatensis]